MKIDICIVSYNTKEILCNCLESLMNAVEYSNKKDEIIYTVYVVDNASHDGSADMVKKKFPKINLVVHDVNVGFARANNVIFSKSDGEYFILINPDAFVHQNTLSTALIFMQNTPRAGACGGLLRNVDGSIASSGRKFPTLMRKFCDMWGLSKIFRGKKVADKQCKVDWVPGTFTVVRRAAFNNLALFDERFFLYYEETDMCRALYARGWQVWFVPEIEIVHIGGASAKAYAADSEKNAGDIDKKLFLDTSGAQLALWRMQSENLYIYKYQSIFGVLGNISIEISRHTTRIVFNNIRYIYYKVIFYMIRNNTQIYNNIKKKKDLAYTNKSDSYQKIIVLCQALKNTRFGRVSPKIPWG